MGLNSFKTEMTKDFASLQASKANKAQIRNLNHEFGRLLSLICGSITEFSLYDTSKIAVSISRSRRMGRMGTLAYVVPLRYVGGGRERRGKRWGIPGVYEYESHQIEKHQPGACYIMTFLVPKFFSLKPMDRLETMVHELYHLHPTMRGDLRRFPAPHIHHGPTPARYQKKVKDLCSELIQNLPTLCEHPLLSLDPDGIGRFQGKRFNIPRHVFKPKPFSLFATVLLSLVTGLAQAAEIPVVIIQQGHVHVAPSESSGKEIKTTRGESFQAHGLSKDRKWVWVSNARSKGWVKRDLIQSGDLLDKRLGIAGAFVDAKVPNKLGEKKVGDFDEFVEDDRALQVRNNNANDLAPPGSGNAATNAPLSDLELLLPENTDSALSSQLDLSLRGDLEEAPSADQLESVSLSPEEKNHLEEGERVSKAQIKAQSRLSPIKKNNFEFKDASSETNQNLGVVTWEESFDPDLDRANVTSEGKLFENPDEESRRYGILEVGDDVLPLAHTEDGAWQRIRLQDTGEEGWYPSSSIKITQANRQQAVVYKNALEIYGAYGSRGYNFGFGAGYFYHFNFDDQKRSFAIGLDVSLGLGQSLELLTGTFASDHRRYALLGRYDIPSKSSEFGAMVEAGLVVEQLIVATSGLSAATLAAEGFPAASLWSYSPTIGAGVRYGLSPNLDLYSLVRVVVSSNASVQANVGLRGRF